MLITDKIQNSAIVDTDDLKELKQAVREAMVSGEWCIEYDHPANNQHTGEKELRYMLHLYRNKELYLDLAQKTHITAFGGMMPVNYFNDKPIHRDTSLRIMHFLMLSIPAQDRDKCEYLLDVINDYRTYTEQKFKIKRYMNVAAGISAGSKCQKANHGCIIVSDYDAIVGTGFNFHPRQTSKDDVCKRQHVPSGTNTHIGYCCHAEINAIINSAPRERQHGTLYVTSAPCNVCALYIMQSGVDHMVYIERPLIPYRGASLFHELGSSVIPICAPEDTIS
jgi:deoxycytidylate deaminase